MKNLVIHVTIYDFHDLKPDQFVLFAEKIEATGPMEQLDTILADQGLTREGCSITDGKGGFLLPGFVAAHTHLYSTFARGWLTPFSPRSFQDVLDQLWWKLDHFLGKEEIYLSGLTGAGEFLHHGVTTVIDHHASGKVIRGSLDALKQGAVTEGGLRALFCFESSDRYDLKQCIDENVAFFTTQQKSGNTHCTGMFGMHASFSLADASLKEIAAASPLIPIHVHVAESKEDTEWTQNSYGKNIIKRFNDFGLLRKSSLLAHGVHLEDDDFELIKKQGCSLVFNPTSNMNNGVGLPPLEQALAHDIPWMLGNDGLGFTMTRDFQNLLFSYQLLHGPGSFQLPWLKQSITRTYEYVNDLLGCSIGRIQAGFDADFFILSYQPITPLNENNILGHFFFGILDTLHPSSLWVGGKQHIRDGILLHEERYHYDEARACSRRLWETIANS